MKKKLILTFSFILSLMPMVLSQYGAIRGVEEISGLYNLKNPIGILAILCYFIGVWNSHMERKNREFFSYVGVIGIVIAELYTYVMIQIPAMSNQGTITNSVLFAYPEFYIGVIISLMMIVFYWIVSTRIQEEPICLLDE